jgi:hypothetical protein
VFGHRNNFRLVSRRHRVGGKILFHFGSGILHVACLCRILERNSSLVIWNSTNKPHQTSIKYIISAAIIQISANIEIGVFYAFYISTQDLFNFSFCNVTVLRENRSTELSSNLHFYIPYIATISILVGHTVNSRPQRISEMFEKTSFFN